MPYQISNVNAARPSVEDQMITNDSVQKASEKNELGLTENHGPLKQEISFHEIIKKELHKSKLCAQQPYKNTCSFNVRPCMNGTRIGFPISRNSNVVPSIGCMKN